MKSTPTARTPRPPRSVLRESRTPTLLRSPASARRWVHRVLAGASLATTLGMAGCLSPEQAVKSADDAAYSIIEQKQLAALGRVEPFVIDTPEDTLRRRLLLDQDLPAAGPASFGRAYLSKVPKQPDNISRGPGELVGARIVGTRGAPTPGVNRPNFSTDLFLYQVGPRGTVQIVTSPLPGYGATLGVPQITPEQPIEPLRISLLDALKIGARSSRAFQSAKESVYIAALDLDLERDAFEFRFNGALDADIQSELEGADTSGVSVSPRLGFSKLFKSGALITSQIGLDLAKLLSGNEGESLGLLADAAITIPLLRGAGVEVVTEPLQQAEREAIYAIWDFERFKREFAIDVVTRYYNVLQSLDSVANAEATYTRLVANTERTRSLAAEGNIPPVQVTEVQISQLQAYTRLISSQQQYEQQLDSFKVFLGLPPDSYIELDPAELKQLQPLAERVLGPAFVAGVGAFDAVDPMRSPAEPEVAVDAALIPDIAADSTTQPGMTRDEIADAVDPTEAAIPPTTQPTSRPTTQPTTQPGTLDLLAAFGPDSDKSPYSAVDLEYRSEAIRLALENRLDLATSYATVADAQRRLVVAADALESVFDLNAGVSLGGGRGPLSGGASDSNLRFDEGSYSAGLNFDLPIERTAERNQYRIALINLERAVRSAQEAEDSVKLDVITRLRNLRVAAENLKVQASSIRVARSRLEQAEALNEVGRGEVRDITEASADLLDAQNAFTRNLVDFRVAELELQRDIGLLEVDENGVYVDRMLIGETL